MAINPFDFFVPVPRPERPKNKIGSISAGEEREPVDSTMLPDPVTNLNVMRMGIFGNPAAFACLVVKKPCWCSAVSKRRRDASRWGCATALQIYCGCV